MKNTLKNLLVLSVLFFLISCNRESEMVDQDGNRYSTRVYSGTEWMTENLRARTTIKGRGAPFYFPNSDTSTLSSQNYGLLYDYPTACKVCPEGWRVPTVEEWESLFKSISMKSNIVKDPIYWEEEGNTNKSGFNARPAGYGNNGQYASYFGEKVFFWAIDPENVNEPYTYIIEKGEAEVRKAQQHNFYGFSVRCVREK